MGLDDVHNELEQMSNFSLEVMEVPEDCSSSWRMVLMIHTYNGFGLVRFEFSEASERSGGE